MVICWAISLHCRYLGSTLAVSFDFIHRSIGGSQQGFAVRTGIGIDGDTNGGIDRTRACVDVYAFL